MRSKPMTPKKGTSFFVEPIQSMTNDPTIKGDVVKKFVDGKLVKQIFVSKNRMKKIVQTAKHKSQKKQGGRTRKVLRPKLLRPQRKQSKRVRKLPVQPQPQPQPIYVDQPVPQGQIPAQQIYAADNTTMGQAAKQGLAGGVGFFAAEALVGGIVGAFTDN
jgi:hypothetical protein